MKYNYVLIFFCLSFFVGCAKQKEYDFSDYPKIQTQGNKDIKLYEVEEE